MDLTGFVLIIVYFSAHSSFSHLLHAEMLENKDGGRVEGDRLDHVNNTPVPKLWSDGPIRHTHTHTNKDPHTWTDRNRQRNGHTDPYIIYLCVCVCVRGQD